MQITVTFIIKADSPKEFGRFKHDDLKTVFFEALDRSVTAELDKQSTNDARNWLHNNVVSTQEGAQTHGS